MQNFKSIPDTSKTTWKAVEEIEKEFEESIINGEKNEEKASQVEKCENAAAAVGEFEDIIKDKEKDFIGLCW